MKVPQRRKYDTSVIARCLQLTNFDASIVIMTLDVRHKLWRKNYKAGIVIYDRNGFSNTGHWDLWQT